MRLDSVCTKPIIPPVAAATSNKRETHVNRKAVEHNMKDEVNYLLDPRGRDMIITIVIMQEGTSILTILSRRLVPPSSGEHHVTAARWCLATCYYNLLLVMVDPSLGHGTAHLFISVEQGFV